MSNLKEFLNDKNPVVQLLCEDCEQHLMSVSVVEAPIQWKIRAECGYCGGTSKVHDVYGLFKMAGNEMCDILDFQVDDDEGVVIFITAPATGER